MCYEVGTARVTLKETGTNWSKTKRAEETHASLRSNFRHSVVPGGDSSKVVSYSPQLKEKWREEQLGRMPTTLQQLSEFLRTETG